MWHLLSWMPVLQIHRSYRRIHSQAERETSTQEEKSLLIMKLEASIQIEAKESKINLVK